MVNESVKRLNDSWKWKPINKKCLDCGKKLMFRKVTSYTKKCGNCGRTEY